jgi:hypothetical protein
MHLRIDVCGLPKERLSLICGQDRRNALCAQRVLARSVAPLALVSIGWMGFRASENGSSVVGLIMGDPGVTLIVIATSNAGVALVADQLVLHTSGGSGFYRKLFIKANRVAVASWGAGPLDLPQRIDALEIGNENAEQTAATLGRAFASLSANFTLYVAGHETARPLVWQIHIPGNGQPAQVPDSFTPGQTRVLPPIVPNGFPGIPPGFYGLIAADLDADQLLQLATDRALDAYHIAPALISQQMQRVLVTAQGAREL